MAKYKLGSSRGSKTVSTSGTMIRAVEILEKVYDMAKQSHDTDTMMNVAQAFAEISVRLSEVGSLTVATTGSDGKQQPVGFHHHHDGEKDNGS